LVFAPAACGGLFYGEEEKMNINRRSTCTWIEVPNRNSMVNFRAGGNYSFEYSPSKANGGGFYRVWRAGRNPKHGCDALGPIVFRRSFMINEGRAK